jgi:hypothetical protein
MIPVEKCELNFLGSGLALQYIWCYNPGMARLLKIEFAGVLYYIIANGTYPPKKTYLNKN